MKQTNNTPHTIQDMWCSCHSAESSIQRLNVFTMGNCRRRRNMNCDMGDKTEIFHKAQRRSGAEHDDMRSKPLRGMHASLFAREEGVERCGDRCCSCYVLVRGEGSPTADDERKTRVLLDLNMKRGVSVLILDVPCLFVLCTKCVEDRTGMRENPS